MTNLTTLSAEEINRFVAEQMPPGFIEKPKEPQKKAICLCILTYNATIMTRTMTCLLQALTQCAEKGWGFTYILREADSMVARGRSLLASQFLVNPNAANCSDLVFVDTDLEWKANEFVRLCEHDVDIVGGAYPYKDDSGDFPLRWPADGLMEKNGLWEVQAVTPGFLRISRRCLEKIAKDQPWLEFKDRFNPEGQRSWMFFDNLQRPSGVYDEGYIFAEHAHQAGFKVYLDPDLNLTHIGLRAYNHGTIRQWLERKAETFDRLESEFPNVPPLVLMRKTMGEKIDLAEEAKKRAKDVSSPAA